MVFASFTEVGGGGGGGEGGWEAFDGALKDCFLFPILFFKC